MKWYYAPGGGMGHLSRGLAVAHTHGWSTEEVVFISASPFAQKILKGWRHVPIPQILEGKDVELRQWLIEKINQDRPDQIFLDVFPVGLFGEWNGINLKDVQLNLICRHIRWNNYSHLVSDAPFFSNAYILEPLGKGQTHFLHKNCQNLEAFSLKYPSSELPQEIHQLLKQLPRPIWLVIHSQPLEEVEALIDMAKDQARMEEKHPCILVISQEILDDSDIICQNWQQAYRFFSYAERLFTGAGFNLMQQTIPFKEKHQFLPFIRKYDDQFMRAKMRKMTNDR